MEFPIVLGYEAGRRAVYNPDILVMHRELIDLGLAVHSSGYVGYMLGASYQSKQINDGSTNTAPGKVQDN